MNFKKHFNKKNAGVLGLIGGSLLLGMTAVPMAGIAESDRSTQINGEATEAQLVAQTRVTPSPDIRQYPVAYIQPQNAPVDIQLINKTNDRVTFQVIGDTDERYVSDGGETMLENIEIPVTVTFVRSDNGLLRVEPEVVGPGQIRLYLDEAYTLDGDVQNMRIDPTGEMYLY